jgi:hypothetical protein
MNIFDEFIWAVYIFYRKTGDKWKEYFHFQILLFVGGVVKFIVFSPGLISTNQKTDYWSTSIDLNVENKGK